MSNNDNKSSGSGLLKDRSKSTFQSFPHLALPFAMVLTVTDCAAQTPVVLEDSITRVIDAEVWRPFVSAFDTRDAEAFVAIHATNAIRWSLGWGQPQGRDSIAVQARRNWSMLPPPGETRTIELYFTHRSRTAAFAFDIGYYRVLMSMPGGVAREHFGHFSTILGKVDGRWKIFLDADNGEGVTLDDLKQAVPLRKD